MQLEVIGINDSPWGTRPNPQKVDSQDRSPSPGSCFRLLVVSQNRSWDLPDPRTGPGTSPRTGPGTSPGTGPGTSPRTGVWFWDCLRSQDWSDRSWDQSRTGSWCDRWYWVPIQCHLKPLQTPFRTGTQDTGQGPRSSLPATKPARAVIDVLVVVEDPWIYSARESNTSSQTAPDWDQPAAGDRSRATSGGPVSGRPRERRLLPANSK